MNSSSSEENVFFINGDQETEFPGVYFENLRYRLPSKYEIQRVMGDVLLGLDKDSGRRVKIRHFPDPFSNRSLSLSLLKDLVRQVSCFNHYPFFKQLDNVVIPHASGSQSEDSKEIFFIYELINGSLYNRVREFPPLGRIQIARYFSQILIAVSSLQRMNIPFMLDPRKILLADNDDSVRLGVDDFTLTDEEPPQIPLLPLEAPCYESYEVVFKDADDNSRESDTMWTLGCILSEMITGRSLVVGSNREEQKGSIVYSPDLEYLNSGFDFMDEKFFGSELLQKHSFGISSAIPNGYKRADPLAISLLSCLLRMTENSRISLQGALVHPWIIQCLSQHPEWNETLHFIESSPPTLTSELDWRLTGLHLGLTEKRKKKLIWNEVLKLEMGPDGSPKHNRQHLDDSQHLDDRQNLDHNQNHDDRQHLDDNQPHDDIQVRASKGYIARDFEDNRFQRREEKKRKHSEKLRRRRTHSSY